MQRLLGYLIIVGGVLIITGGVLAIVCMAHLVR